MCSFCKIENIRPSRSPKGGVSDQGGGTSSAKTGIGELWSHSFGPSQRKRKNSGNVIENPKHGPISKKATTTSNSKNATLSKNESDFHGFRSGSEEHCTSTPDLDAPSTTVSNSVSDFSSINAGLINSSAPVIVNDAYEAQIMI